MRIAPLLAFLIAAPAAALGQEAPPGGEPQTITVTGVRIQNFRDALARCLARHCPVDQDVNATLALAEVEFESGDYTSARRTVAASLGRNRDRAATYPEPVADLHRARARVARHLGRDDEAVRSTYDILRALERGIPAEDYRHYTARLEIAEMMMVSGRLEAARTELNTLAEHARAGGRPDVAMLAELRATWISYLLAPYGGARARLIAMSRDTDPAQRVRATGAKILLARIYRDQGDVAQADALITDVARNHSGRRGLVYSPPYLLLSRETVEEGGMANINTRVTDVFEDQWIDVGFWVEADGRVDGLEIIRKRGSTDWADPLLRSIRGRVYTASADGTPTFRLERYTYTAPMERVTGSRIMQRSPRARVEYYDLSTGEPPPEDVVPGRSARPSGPAATPATPGG